MIFVTGMAMLVSANDSKERGRVIGFSIAATYSGLSLGPFLGGLITHYASWRLIFFISTAVLALSWWLCSKIEGEWHGNKKGGLDYRGSILYFISSLSIMYGLSVFVSEPLAPALIGAGIGAGSLFLLENRRSKAPLLDFSLFRNVIFAMSNAAAFLHYSATFAISFLMSLYLQVIRGFDEVTAGTILLLQPIMMASLSPTAGKLSDKFEPRLVASMGMGMTALGLFALSRCDIDTDLRIVGAILLFIGTGFAFFSAPNSSAIMGSVPPKEFGIASSIMSMMRIFGQSMSMVLVTLLISAYVLPAYETGYVESLAAGIQKIFTLFSLICAIGV
ncbi:MAG: MFS transporter, partial [Selenomonadaceae bacterium]|nr:MFS transporter [Selenomonadaceae bacterium]